MKKVTNIWTDIAAKAKAQATGFQRRADGAVTVDWVVMTAVVCIIAGVTMTAVRAGAVDLVDDLSTTMDAKSPE